MRAESGAGRLAHRLILALIGAVAVGSAVGSPPRDARAALSLVVTSAGDDELAQCPDDEACTLRAAIVAVNGDEGEGPYHISFHADVFGEEATPITLESGPLPLIARDDVTIDASGLDVRIDGVALEGDVSGLVLVGSASTVRSVHLRGFSNTCLTLAGDESLAERVRVGGCTTGILATGAGSRLLGNEVGFGTGNNAAPLVTGIHVAGNDAMVGEIQAGPGAANTIGNAQFAIQVGFDDPPGITGVVVAGNIIGKAASGGGGAPVGTGILIRAGAARTEVVANTIANTVASGVVVAADFNGLSSHGNVISSNRFEAVGALSIDLGGEGLLNTNDPGDVDEGPNRLLNHPVITRAVQSGIQGTACGGCTIELYVAQHFPGGTADFGATPISGGVLAAQPSGLFELDAPPIAPGQWITAIARDQDGNTSEFAPSSRVGAGVAQCGDIALQPGWNLVGFFGQASLPLGNVYPADSGAQSLVSAIYRLIDGTLGYQAWFSDGAPGRTLNTLQSGEAYWMFAVQPAPLTGGFSLTVPLPVSLVTGWNEFVYIGASADVRDALASISGKYTSVHQWSSGESRWLSHHAGLPSWAQGFTGLETCAAYSIFVSEDTTLTPLQP